MGSEETIVYIGNRDAFELVTDPETGERTHRVLEGKRCTTVRIPADFTLMEAAQCITHPQGAWAAHSTGRPAWVASTSAALGQLLAEHWECELRQPEPDHVPSGTPDTGLEG